jgi:hypothetical protein
LISPLRTFVASFFALLLTGFNFQQIHIYVQDTDYITALLCCNIHKGVKMRCSSVAIFSLRTSHHTTCMQFHLSQQMTKFHWVCVGLININISFHRTLQLVLRLFYIKENKFSKLNTIIGVKGKS